MSFFNPMSFAVRRSRDRSARSRRGRRASGASFAVTAIYTHFFAGDFLRATGASENIDFFELTLDFKF